jgi:NADP-dependent aldehyde dehydrogenase
MLQSIDPKSGSAFGEPLAESTAADIDAMVAASVAAFERWPTSAGAARAQLLRTIATALEAQRDSLVALADRETALGPPRLNGELDRTALQLRGFAREVEDGAPFRCTDDPAVTGAPPAGRPRLTRVRVPIGPVAMFAASNFPFAFSALAAGCTVVVKAHPEHPQLSQAVFKLARGVIAAHGLDAGVMTLVQGASNDVADGIRPAGLEGQAGHRHRQHVERRQPVPRALQAARRGRQARRAAGGRLSG